MTLCRRRFLEASALSLSASLFGSRATRAVETSQPEPEGFFTVDKRHGRWWFITPDGEQGRYRGSGLATAYLSGKAACLAEAMPHKRGDGILQTLRRAALVPIPEIGYG